MPVVLSSDDIDANYEQAPEAIRSTKSWLGLFIEQAQTGGERGRSRLAETRIRFVDSGEPGAGQRMETTPPNPTLLVSGVHNIAPGPAITATRFVDLSHDKPEAEIRLGERVYTIHLVSRAADYCDAVISLTSGTLMQKVFDLRNRPPQWSCDDPHFRVHWAGDLDRDGKLDMLVTFSEKYSYHPRQLFLSSTARPPDFVAEVARFERFSQ
jgi:hypothetical protein